jgi:sigma-E factor negative regulatory protein RseC
MIEARVRVVSAADGMAWVTSSESSGCSACQSQSSCGISGLGKYLTRRRAAMSLAHADARAGDELLVCVDETELLRAGAFAYLLPAMLAVLGAGLADALGSGDLAAGELATVFAALIGFIGGLIAARFLAPTPRIRTSPITPISGETS